jgi:TolB-like protein
MLTRRSFVALALALAPLLAAHQPALADTPAPAEPQEPKKKPTAAVLYFDNLGESEELFALRKGLTQMLISDLSYGTGFNLVERTRLQDIIDELELGQSKKIDPATAAKIGKLLGADYLVMGGYFEMRGSMRIDVRVVAVETGVIVKSLGATGKGDDFFAVQQELAQGLTKVMETLTPIPANPNPAKPRPTVPKKVKTKTAARYGKALDLVDKGDKEGAKKELQAVVEEAPDFGLASDDLASLMR